MTLKKRRRTGEKIKKSATANDGDGERRRRTTATVNDDGERRRR